MLAQLVCQIAVETCGPSDAEIEAQIEARKAAKACKDFAAADGIREALKAQGIELIDKAGGITEWLRS